MYGVGHTRRTYVEFKAGDIVVVRDLHENELAIYVTEWDRTGNWVSGVPFDHVSQAWCCGLYECPEAEVVRRGRQFELNMRRLGIKPPTAEHFAEPPEQESSEDVKIDPTAPYDPDLECLHPHCMEPPISGSGACRRHAPPHVKRLLSSGPTN
jgi:hypothetical protein